MSCFDVCHKSSVYSLLRRTSGLLCDDNPAVSSVANIGCTDDGVSIQQGRNLLR